MISATVYDPYQRGVRVALTARMNVEYHGRMSARYLTLARTLSGLTAFCSAAAAASFTSAVEKIAPDVVSVMSPILVVVTAIIAVVNTTIHPADAVAKHAGVLAQYLAVAGKAETFCGRDDHKLQEVEKLEEALLAAESSEAAFESRRNYGVWNKVQGQVLKAAGFRADGQPSAA